MSKITIRLFCIFLSGIMLVTIQGQKADAQEVVASYQTFYDEMSPYGQWVSDEQYGDVWVPNAEAGYRPYATNGHWAMTEYGNMWISDEPYGWACYHYGRWTYNSYYGWVWIPGHEWAPAWVSWRSGNGYYGWAPMGPGFEAGGSYQCPDNYWVFVSPDYLYHPNVYSYYDANRNYYYCQHTVYLHDTYDDHGMRYNYGPRREVIEREAHQPVQVYRVSNAGNPRETRESGNVVQIYRPNVRAESQRTARPSNVMAATQPIGRPQEVARGQENRQPAFREEMQKHPGNYPGTAGQRLATPQNNAGQNVNQGGRNQQQMNNTQRSNQEERNQLPANRTQQQFDQQVNRTQSQGLQQQGHQPPVNQQSPQQANDRQPGNRPQSQHFQQQNNQPQNNQQGQQYNNRPSQNNNQQQMNRPQPQQGRPQAQPQMQQQMNRPQSQPQPRQQAPQRDETKRR